MPRCERLDRMINENEEARIKEPLQVIREYLSGQFEGFKLTEKSDYPVSYKFTVTKLNPLEQYSLKVTWPRLSDGNNNTAMIRKLLVGEDVAKRMRAKPQGEAYSWGKHWSEAGQPAPSLLVLLTCYVLFASPVSLDRLLRTLKGKEKGTGTAADGGASPLGSARRSRDEPS